VITGESANVKGHNLAKNALWTFM